MDGATVEFRFDSPTDEEQFLRTYLAEAWERFERSDF